MDNIFITQEKFVVKKITKTTDGWILHTNSLVRKEVFISRKYYSGKMPPFFRLPRQKFELEITSLEDFILSAKINGKLLFEVSHDALPPEVKQTIEKGEKLAQIVKEREDAIDKDIKAALEQYLPLLKVDFFPEDKMYDLHICFRAYLKLHLQKGEKIPYFKERIYLATLLCQAAQRICRRHFNFDNPLSICAVLSSFQADLMFHDRPYDYSLDDPSMDKIFAIYHEVEDILDTLIPRVDNKMLKRYLVCTVEDLSKLFMDDYSVFVSQSRYSLITGEKIDSDGATYRAGLAKIKLPYFKSFILPAEVDKVVVENFLFSCTL